MSEQLKDKCAICGSYLFDDDDIVYCPECGAPHHRDCYNTIGHCGRADMHEQLKSEPSNPPEQPKECVCKRCKKALPENTNFCPYCGTINKDINIDFGEFAEQIKINLKAKDIDKDEEIDGVRVKDIRKFVNFNAPKIINIFKQMAKTGKKVSLNWMAFICPQAHALFRKMYMPSYIYTLLDIISVVLIAPFVNGTMGTNLEGKNFINYILLIGSKELAHIKPITIIFALLGCALFLGARLFACMYNDYMYKNYTIKTIKAIRADLEVNDDEAFYKKGGVRPFLALLLFSICYYYGENLLLLIIELFF